MTEFHFLPKTSEALTPELVDKAGYTFIAHGNGYSIEGPTGIIYGRYSNDMIQSFYPGRNHGEWIDMLKRLDRLVYLEFYSDYFEDLQMHEDWDEDQTIQQYKAEVTKCRKLFGLHI